MKEHSERSKRSKHKHPLDRGCDVGPDVGLDCSRYGKPLVRQCAVYARVTPGTLETVRAPCSNLTPNCSTFQDGPWKVLSCQCVPPRYKTFAHRFSVSLHSLRVPYLSRHWFPSRSCVEPVILRPVTFQPTPASSEDAWTWSSDDVNCTQSGVSHQEPAVHQHYYPNFVHETRERRQLILLMPRNIMIDLIIWRRFPVAKIHMVYSKQRIVLYSKVERWDLSFLFATESSESSAAKLVGSWFVPCKALHFYCGSCRELVVLVESWSLWSIQFWCSCTFFFALFVFYALVEVRWKIAFVSREKTLT